MSRLTLLTDTPPPAADVVPALSLLPHTVRVLPATPSAVLDACDGDAILLDARRDLVAARALCGVLHAAAGACPVLVVLTEGGLAAVSTSWGLDDVLVETVGPAELEARLRMAAERRRAAEGAGGGADLIRAGALTIDETSYTARVGGRRLDLTYKEFELLRFLAQQPDRVFSRAQLLQEVWGYDYFGGTRTVDVHVRRLRAKLGDHDSLIGTVRHVGYRFVSPDGDGG